MQFARRFANRIAFFALTLGFLGQFVATAQAAENARLEVTSYVIDAELQPATHRLVARAKVTFTAPDDLVSAVFELHNGLRVTKVTDAEGNTLTAERVSQDNTVRIALPAGLIKDGGATLNFEYDGVLQSADDSPVPGLKLAYVGNDLSYLLYAARWFPVSGYGTDRFTATISITAPKEFEIIGTGRGAAPPPVAVAEPTPTKPLRKNRRAAATPTPQRPAPTAGTQTVTFSWDKPGFPGTILAGRFFKTTNTEGGLNLAVYTLADKKQFSQPYADAASKAFFYFITRYGPPTTNTLNVVQLPDDTVPAAWAPEIAAIAGRAIHEKVNYRLLANTIAHQWWGSQVSPATKSDWWLSDGFARYSEALYVEHVAGAAALNEAVKDMSVGALAYQSVPLSSINTLDMFSPEFQSLATDKGAMILHMLRFVLGEDGFYKAMNRFATQYAGKPATADDFQAVCEQVYNNNKLTWFFTQWLDSTSAPEFQNKYTIYRMGNGKGFRIVGQVTQDLDLFRMPVELKVDTDGKTEMRTVEVVGTESTYSVETFGKPRRITIDPNDRVLKNSTDVQLRSSIMRGQALVQQNDLAEALKEFQKALGIDKNSSLAHYRIADVFYLQRNYQSAANEYRESLNGNGEPRWTEVWSHIQLGKIFDITGQRERALNEYRQALQTNDNTQNALDEARKYLQKPFEPESTRTNIGR